MKMFIKFMKASTLCAALLAANISSAAADTITVGYIGALTGGGASWGLATSEGVRIATEEINEEGGLEVNGERREIEVIAYDDQYNAANSVAAYNRLVRRDGAKFVFLMSSSGSLAVKRSVEGDQVVALSSAYSDKVTDADTQFMYRLFSVADNYAPGLIEWLADNTEERQIFLLNPNDETGWDQAELTEPNFEKHGYEVLGSELYERSLNDFQPLLTRVLNTNPDVVDLGSSSPGTAGLIARQIRDLGYEGLIVKTGGSGPEATVEAAGKKAAEGMINILYADPENKNVKQLSAKYEKAMGHQPNAIIVPFYDAAKVLFSAIQKAGTVEDTARIASAFKEVLPTASVQGDTLNLGGEFNHHIITPMYVGVIKDGKPVVVDKIESD